MHLGKVESDMYPFFIAEGNKLPLYFFIIKKGELIVPYFDPLAYTGVFIQVVVFTKVAFVQYLVHHFAPFAAKRPIIK